MPFARDLYDIVVIGGGTAGVATGLELRQRGYDVAIIEQFENCGLGTNNQALGILPRRLTYFAFDRPGSFAAAYDVSFLHHLFPKIVAKRPFAMPFFPQMKRHLKSHPVILEGLMASYARATADKAGLSGYRYLNQKQILEEIPVLKENVMGGILFEEYVTDPVELCRAILAKEKKLTVHGTLSVFSGQQVKSFLIKHGKLRAAICINNQLEREVFYGKYFVNATGPWSAEMARMAGVDIKLNLSQGATAVIDRKFTKYAIITFDETGKYITLLPLPDRHQTLIGPTDIPIEKISDAAIHEYELENLAEVASKTIRNSIEKFDFNRPLTRCGVRPLLSGAHKTRAYAIVRHTTRPNFFSLTGSIKIIDQIRAGKEMADILDEINGKPKCDWPNPELLELKYAEGELDAIRNSYQKKYARNSAELGLMIKLVSAYSTLTLAPDIIWSFIKNLGRKIV